jgi:hypothetical protein
MRSSILLSLLPLASAVPWGNPWGSGGGSSPTSPNYENVTIFMAPEDWPHRSTSYARVVILNQDCEEDNTILTTFTLTPPSGRYYPVFSSHDLGQSWEQISQIEFGPETGKDFSGGRLAQPYFMELPSELLAPLFSASKLKNYSSGRGRVSSRDGTLHWHGSTYR